jgi:hypothetical protein
MLGSNSSMAPSLVQNAQLSFTKQPPEDGGLTHQPDASIWKPRMARQGRVSMVPSCGCYAG